MLKHVFKYFNFHIILTKFQVEGTNDKPEMGKSEIWTVARVLETTHRHSLTRIFMNIETILHQK